MAVSEVEMSVGPHKTIALVAHDNMKDELLEWVGKHREELSRHTLIGTGTTGGLVHEKIGLPVERLRSGPLGGDQQIGARISEGEVDVLLVLLGPASSRSLTTPTSRHCFVSLWSGTFLLRVTAPLQISSCLLPTWTLDYVRRVPSHIR